MTTPEEVDYTVLLVFPGFGAERENAEAIVEGALGWLNANKEEPGFRFAPAVSAHLEMVQDDDAARDRIAEDGNVALVLLHDLPEDERAALVRHCAERRIGAGYTVDAPRPDHPHKGPMKVVLRSQPSDEPPAHRIVAETLTAPVGEDDQTQERIGELIAVLALGVMQYHWGKRQAGEGPRRSPS
jgi:hypothetical protein